MNNKYTLYVSGGDEKKCYSSLSFHSSLQKAQQAFEDLKQVWKKTYRVDHISFRIYHEDENRRDVKVA